MCICSCDSVLALLKKNSFQRYSGYFFGFLVLATMITLDIKEKTLLEDDDFEGSALHNERHVLLNKIFWFLWLLSFA